MISQPILYPILCEYRLQAANMCIIVRQVCIIS